jgi:hypothetical protein
MGFSIGGSWKMNLNDSKLSYYKLNLILTIKLTLGKLVLAKRKANNNYEFYQRATLGDYDLRGFRNLF